MAAMMIQALATPFEDGDPMPLALQAQGLGQTGNSRADHGDLVGVHFILFKLE